MVERGDDQAGRPDGAEDDASTPANDAPTSPIPRIRPGAPPPPGIRKSRPPEPDAQSGKGSASAPTLFRVRSSEPPAGPVRSAPPRPSGDEPADPQHMPPPAPPVDPETTVRVRRPGQGGSFPGQWPQAGVQQWEAQGARRPPAPPRPDVPVAGPPAPEPPRRPGDLPLRFIYTAGALIVAVIAIVLIFTLFSGDKPPPPPPVAQTSAEPSPSPTASPTPTPITLPAVPKSKGFPSLPGKATKTKGSVVDAKAGISYAKLGKPWVKAKVGSFASAQLIGENTAPRTMIGSRSLPIPMPKSLKTAEQYRALAVKVAEWTLRYQPPGIELTWTGSQPLPGTGQLGWLLEYQLDYNVNGVKHSSEAIVAVVRTAKKKPGVLFATVPDSRQTQYRDLATLLKTVRKSS